MNEDYRKFYEDALSCAIGIVNDLKAMNDEGNREDVQSVNHFYYHMKNNLAELNYIHELSRKYFPH